MRTSSVAKNAALGLVTLILGACAGIPRGEFRISRDSLITYFDERGEFVARDGNGNEIHPMGWKEKPHPLSFQDRLSAANGPFVWVPPGTQLKEEVDLSKLFEFKRPGDYRIIAKRRLPQVRDEDSELASGESLLCILPER